MVDLAQDLEQAFTKRFAVLWRDILYPALKGATPMRTGQLRAAMQIGYADGKFVVYMNPSGFYWRFQKNLLQKYQAIYDRLIPLMVDTAFEQAKRDVGLE